MDSRKELLCSYCRVMFIPDDEMMLKMMAWRECWHNVAVPHSVKFEEKCLLLLPMIHVKKLFFSNLYLF
jgi:hypothetical protein